MADLLTADFDFDLPPEFIAQAPAEPRDSARLLHVSEKLSDHHVRHLPGLLRAGDVLVMNDTRVIPARIHGKRGAVEIEVLLLRKCGPQDWLAFARPGKRLRIGDRVDFADGVSSEVVEKREEGK